jgi:cytochrome c-type biogenesis protein CcsB
VSSTAWIQATDVLCYAGLAAAALAAFLHWRAARAGRGPEAGTNPASWAMVIATVAALATMSLAMWQRYVEVNHFPSQTMSEVLCMFSLALLVSVIALHFALGLQRRGPGWAILDDVIVALVLGGVIATHHYVNTLPTAQRDLPPALQSWWFPPHLSALIFSYATLGIAGLICLVYFCARFWSGVFQGGRSMRTQILIALALVLVPYLQVVTIPVLLLSGAVFAGLRAAGRLPSRLALAGLEKELDDVSFRAFAVGMPFLTGGLWMGAFWAQEAWANYWGWDSKENSALITWLVYVIYIHLRMLGGYRGEKAMAVLAGGAFSIFITFQLFGYLPDSQKSMHRYTDSSVVPKEGMQGPPPEADGAQAQAPPPPAASATGDAKEDGEAGG